MLAVGTVGRRLRRTTRFETSTAAPTAATSARTLADLRRGETARIVGYDGEPGTSRRLFELGLVPGAEIEVVRVAPLRDPVIFRVADYDLALRRSEARGIHVA